MYRNWSIDKEDASSTPAFLLFTPPWGVYNTSSVIPELAFNKMHALEDQIYWCPEGTGERFHLEELELDLFTGTVYFVCSHFQRFATETSEANQIFSTKEMLSEIRAHLSLTITELASSIGVERPTVYAWLEGRSKPRRRNLDRMQKVFEIAQKWAEISDLPVGNMVRHADESGGSVIELLRSGQMDNALLLLKTIHQSIAERPASDIDAWRAKTLDFVRQHHLESDKETQQAKIDELTGKRIGPE